MTSRCSLLLDCLTILVYLCLQIYHALELCSCYIWAVEHPLSESWEAVEMPSCCPNRFKETRGYDMMTDAIYHWPAINRWLSGQYEWSSFRHVISTDLAPAHGVSDNVSRDNCFLSHALIGATVASMGHKRIITHLPEQSRASDFFLKPRVL